MLFIEAFVVVLLTLVNGLLAMSEMAVVSSRRSRLEHMAGLGNRGAAVALRLFDDPSRFLSTVQIGITLIGILAGAFSGATLADRLGDWLDTIPGLAPNGDAVGIGLVVVAITVLSLIVGELVPKRIALTDPEGVATAVARPMHLLSRAAGPIVWLLKLATEAVLRALRLAEARPEAVTEEEVKSLIAEGTRAGIFAPQEHRMIDAVLRLADRPVSAIMTPRRDIVWIDVAADQATLARLVEANRFSRLLVCEGAVEHPLGVVHVRDLLPAALQHRAIDLRRLVQQALFVPERTSVLALIDRFRREGVHIAVVVDEYGVIDGLATLTDVLEAIAGGLPELGEAAEPMIVRRDDGSWLIDGAMPIDDFEAMAGLGDLRAGGSFNTVAGFVLQQLGHLPTIGESIEYRGARLEVVDMDGRRIDKLIMQPPPAPPAPGPDDGR